MAQLGSAWLSLAQLGSALLCFCFTLFLSGILSLNLASFNPKPFGYVQKCCNIISSISKKCWIFIVSKS